MATNKEQEVLVELAHVHLYWTCPKCRKDNEGEFEKFNFVEQLECDCGVILAKKGVLRWVVE